MSDDDDDPEPIDISALDRFKATTVGDDSDPFDDDTDGESSLSPIRRGDDELAELSVDGDALALFVRRLEGAAGSQDDVAQDQDGFSSDPFEGLTDSDTIADGQVDLNSSIHSMAERGEFQLGDLVAVFDAAEKAHVAMFGDALLSHNVQAMLSPTRKIHIPERIQIDFLKQRDSASIVEKQFESYRTMLMGVVDRHLQAISAANVAGRRSFTSRRRKDDTDANVQLFMNAFASSFTELMVKWSQPSADDVVETVDRRIAEMFAQLRSDVDLERVSRLDMSSNLQALLSQRFDKLETRLDEVVARQLLVDSNRPTPMMMSEPAPSKKQPCCDRVTFVLLVVMQLCIGLMLLELFMLSAPSASSLLRSPS